MKTFSRFWHYLATRAQTHARALTPTRTDTHVFTHARKKKKHTHTQKYLIPITFPRQQRFRERTSLLRYMNTASLVHSVFLKW